MVQLPATAAIEYVAACWVSGAGKIFFPGAYARSPKFNAYTHRLGFSVPDKQTKKQTRTMTKTKTKTKTKTRTKTRTRTKTGTKTKIGTITKIVRGAYASSPQVQCLYAPSRLSVPILP